VVAFAGKRALRIMPALVVSVCLVGYLMGALVSSLPALTYLKDPQTNAWVIHNALFDPIYDLPGVFSGHVFTAANGSLWSLAVEVRAYALVMIAGLLGLLAGWRLGVLVALGGAFVALSIPSVWTSLDPGAQHTIRDICGAGQPGTTVMVAFVVGMLLQTQRQHLKMYTASGVLAAAALIGSFFLSSTFSTIVLVLVLPYLVIFLAYRTPPLTALTRWGDASYAIYLFAFPIEQLIISALGSAATPGLVIAISLPITWLIAIASWHLVEAPALSLKSRLPGAAEQRPRPVRPAAPAATSATAAARPASSPSR
jgi:peptidoglycan/LPS O-acetylase OafA/YrhL